MEIPRKDQTYPTLQMICSAHGPQSRIILKGLQTQHLILECGCAYDLCTELPCHDGNLLDGSFTYEEAREFSVFGGNIEVPAEEYFKRLETIGRGTPEVENYTLVARCVHSAEGVTYLKGTAEDFAGIL